MDEKTKNLILLVNILRLPVFQDYIESEKIIAKRQEHFTPQDLYYNSAYIDDIVDENSNLFPKEQCSRKIDDLEKIINNFRDEGKTKACKRELIRAQMLILWTYGRKRCEAKKIYIENIVSKNDMHNSIIEKAHTMIEKGIPTEKIIDRLFDLENLEVYGW